MKPQEVKPQEVKPLRAPCRPPPEGIHALVPLQQGHGGAMATDMASPRAGPRRPCAAGSGPVGRRHDRGWGPAGCRRSGSSLPPLLAPAPAGAAPPPSGGPGDLKARRGHIGRPHRRRCLYHDDHRRQVVRAFWRGRPAGQSRRPARPGPTAAGRWPGHARQRPTGGPVSPGRCADPPSAPPCPAHLERPGNAPSPGGQRQKRRRAGLRSRAQSSSGMRNPYPPSRSQSSGGHGCLRRAEGPRLSALLGAGRRVTPGPAPRRSALPHGWRCSHSERQAEPGCAQRQGAARRSGRSPSALELPAQGQSQVVVDAPQARLRWERSSTGPLSAPSLVAGSRPPHYAAPAEGEPGLSLPCRW